MATKVMTSIYLTPQQKRRLASRAKQRRTTVSEEIRTALDKHLSAAGEEDELQLSLLVTEANKALDRMIRKLDEAHAAFTQLQRGLTPRHS